MHVLAGLSYPQRVPNGPCSTLSLYVYTHHRNLTGHSVSVRLLVSLRGGSMCCDWMMVAWVGVHWVLFSNKVVTQSIEREGERANGISQLKIQPAKQKFKFTL